MSTQNVTKGDAKKTNGVYSETESSLWSVADAT